MANPIQEWLEKFGKPKQTVSGKTTAAGKASVGTTSKTTAAGRASVKASTSKPETQAQTNLQQQKEAIAKKTHQELINAAYKVADELKLEGGPWPLLRAAGWGHLTDNRGALYKGPAIDEIEKLTPEQKSALKKRLNL
jgi:hypothetical protein